MWLCQCRSLLSTPWLFFFWVRGNGIRKTSVFFSRWKVCGPNLLKLRGRGKRVTLHCTFCFFAFKWALLPSLPPQLGRKRELFHSLQEPPLRKDSLSKELFHSLQEPPLRRNSLLSWTPWTCESPLPDCTVWMGSFSWVFSCGAWFWTPRCLNEL